MAKRRHVLGGRWNSCPPSAIQEYLQNAERRRPALLNANDPAAVGQHCNKRGPNPDPKTIALAVRPVAVWLRIRALIQVARHKW